jgi:predicted RNA-binding Zn ribbon-like protein
MSDKPPAPHELDVVMDFVNTIDLETGKEALGAPSELAAWLSERDLLPGETKLGVTDLRAAIELREALRRTMLAHNGGQVEGPDEALLQDVATRGQLSVRFERGTARLTPRADGLSGALAALLVPVAASMSDGTWRRAKACRADDCHWAFYDFSRNRSGTWCDMAICGNREKVRAYRGRATPTE